MRRILLLIVLFLFSFCSNGESARVPGEIVVGLRQEAELNTLSGLNARFGAGKVSRIKALNAVVLRIETDEIDRVLDDYNKIVEVRYAEPNFIAFAQGVIPDDPYFDQQWYMDRINMPSAWTVSTGSAEIIVGVLDSGIRASHPELAGRVTEGYNFVHGNRDASDDNGHGTFIAGLIGARTNNGFGIAGINWDVSLMPVKVLDRFGAGAYSDVAAGMIFASDMGADVINLSLVGRNPSRLLEDAVNYASRAGSVIVASTGNSNRDSIYFPAAYRHVIAVGAANESDARCDESDWGPGSGSNYGPEIDLIAPGNNIISTSLTGGFAYGSGTSASTALVTGVAALLLSENTALLPGEIRWIINSSAYAPEDDWNPETGSGRLDAGRAFKVIALPLEPFPARRWPFFKPPGDFFRRIGGGVLNN